MSSYISEQIISLSSIIVHIAKDLLPVEARENTMKKIAEIVSRFSDKGVPLLDPEDDLKVCYLDLYFLIFLRFLLLVSNPALLIFRSKVVHTERQLGEWRLWRACLTSMKLQRVLLLSKSSKYFT